MLALVLICRFDYKLHRSFGLIDTSPERWYNLRSAVTKLQDEAPPDVRYKVLFIGETSCRFRNALDEQEACRAARAGLA